MQLPQVGWHAGTNVARHLANELGAETFLADRRLQRAMVFPRSVGPICHDRLVLGAEYVLINVAILDDQLGDPLGMRNRVPEADLRPVIVQPQRVAVEAKMVGDGRQNCLIGVEIIAEPPGSRVSL